MLSRLVTLHLQYMWHVGENRAGLIMHVREVSAFVCAETGQVLFHSRRAGIENIGTQNFLCGLLLDVGTKWMEFCPVSHVIVCITHSCPSSPRKEFGGASAVAAWSAQGNCQSGMVPVVCSRILFFLPLPKGVGSLLTVYGAAVVGVFTGDT